MKRKQQLPLKFERKTTFTIDLCSVGMENNNFKSSLERKITIDSHILKGKKQLIFELLNENSI